MENKNLLEQEIIKVPSSINKENRVATENETVVVEQIVPETETNHNSIQQGESFQKVVEFDCVDTSGGQKEKVVKHKKACKKQKIVKQPEYVTKKLFICCMIFTIIASALLGGIISGRIMEHIAKDSLSSKNSSNPVKIIPNGKDMSVAQIIQANENSVVEILTEAETHNVLGFTKLIQGAGSGIIVRKDGYIITNYHVIEDVQDIEVTLHNERKYSAKIVGTDEINDIAVLKINENNLDAVTIGDSNQLQVGDTAVVIGNPLGQLGGTATSGIISALDRKIEIDGTTMTLLQTDAAINEGNSGGGLFNSQGELVGVVYAKSKGIGIEGLGFAIPINVVKEDIEDIIETGVSRVKGSIGIIINDVTEENKDSYGVEPGVYVAMITGENAKNAGFKMGDKIIRFDGKKVKDGKDLISNVSKHKSGEKVDILIERNGKKFIISTILEEAQE